MTGEPLAEVVVARSAPIARLNLEIARVTGKAATSIRLVRPSVQSCLGEFDALDKQLGHEQEDQYIVHLQAVFTSGGTEEPPPEPRMQGDRSPDMALPFVALEREYLPASGLVSSALGGAFPTSDPWRMVAGVQR